MESSRAEYAGMYYSSSEVPMYSQMIGVSIKIGLTGWQVVGYAPKKPYDVVPLYI